ncbi:hypothetical protein V8D89_001156 [Ganoderma adspersum]
MPSFDRLLVLAVLALSASVQSAPVGSDPGYVCCVNYAMHAHVPIANDLDDEAISLDERGFDDEGADLDEVDEDLETRDFDDAEDVDPDDEDVDSNEEEDDALERRAAKKTKAAPKPKPTKAPKPKTTKAVAPPKTKTTKAKTTKAKTTKAKTTAKETTTKPAKTTKVKTTAKPTKTAKPTTKPAKTKTSKAVPKVSKTTKATGTAGPSACPIKKPAKKPRAFTARAYDYIAHLFERDNEEFVGWHGTNSDTAAFWASKGHIEKPVKADGFLDFLGIGSKSAKGTSGANAEIGPGLYLADKKDTSIVSANINAKANPGTTPALCAIFAKSSGNWRNVIRKAFIPEDIVGDTPEKEALRVAHVKKAVPGVTENAVVRFSILDRREEKTGQMLIPESVSNQFFAKCFKVDGLAVAKSDDAASKVGTNTFPAFEYKGNTLRSEWKIVPETAGGTGAQCS